MSAQLTIQTSPAAEQLDRYAAKELCSYLRQLFGIEATITSNELPVALSCLVLGRDKDSHVRRAAGNLPSLSAQGYVVRRTAPDRMVLAGGSGAAVAWAVYELLEHYGVRFLLHGDVMPRRVEKFHLPNLDLHREPVQSLRSWRIFCDLPTGPVLWSLPQHKSFLDQLFKLRFNGVYCSLWPHHPVIDYQVQGIRRRTAEVLFGQKIPLDADNIGREHLGFGEVLNNPELVHARTYDEKIAAGKQLVHGILDHARSLEMQIAIQIFPFEFPLEFKPLLQKPNEKPIQLGDQTCAERGDLGNANHVEMASTVFQAFLNEYGQKIDEIYLSLPEHPQANDNFSSAWQALSGKYGLEPAFSADTLLQQASCNHLTLGGANRSVNELKSAVAMLNFFDHFFDRTHLLDRAEEKNVRVGLSVGSGSVEIIPLLDRVLWPGAMLTTNLGYTSSRAVRRLSDMARFNPSKVPVALVMTLQDDNVGSLPQVATESIDILLKQMHHLGWRGFYTRFWPIGDLDPVTAYLSRACWDVSVAPRDTYVDHFTHVFGPKSAANCCLVMSMLEAMTIILDMDLASLGFFPVLGIMRRFAEARPMAEGLYHVRALMEQSRYLLGQIESLDEGPAGRAANLSYWISRLTFGIEMINEVERLHEMGRCLAAPKNSNESNGAAVSKLQLEQAQKLLAQAVAAGEAAIRATAANIRDDSDRGTLAAYYHFVVREVRQFGSQMIDAAAKSIVSAAM